jgi:hypothetical protein
MDQVQGNVAMKKRNLHYRQSANRLSAGMDASVDDERFNASSSRYTARQHLEIRSKTNGACNVDATRLLQVEIDSATLLQPLGGRRLCASDIRCLDCESKRCLMGLLLRACAEYMDEDDSKDRHLKTG